MEIFTKLGDEIASRWFATHDDESQFAAIAEDVLRANPLHQLGEPDSVIAWALQAKDLGVQHASRVDFGEPPLMVYRGRRFYIEVLFWLDATTAIHQHGFEGAFCVWGGSSVHTRYRFERRHTFSSRMLVGDLRFEDATLLLPGDVHAIRSGSRLIHSLFHLDRPSVSVVVRTDPLAAEPQYTYAAPHVATDPFAGLLWSRRAAQLVRLLCETHHARAAELAATAIANADDAGAWSLLLQLAELRQRTEAEAEAELSGAATVATWMRELWRAVLDATHKKFAGHADAIVQSATDRAEVISLTRARATVQSADARFFLALVLNIPTREAILRLLQERFAAVDAVSCVMSSVRELSAALGYEFGEDALLLVECILHVPEGQTEGAFAAFAARKGIALSPTYVAELHAALAELREVRALRTLLGGPETAEVGR